jgi:hypothetical protein
MQASIELGMESIYGIGMESKCIGLGVESKFSLSCGKQALD